MNSLYTFDSGRNGPIATIFSGVHGNETSGVRANTMFMKELLQGKVNLLNGKVNLVLRVN